MRRATPDTSCTLGGLKRRPGAWAPFHAQLGPFRMAMARFYGDWVVDRLFKYACPFYQIVPRSRGPLQQSLSPRRGPAACRPPAAPPSCACAQVSVTACVCSALRPRAGRSGALLLASSPSISIVFHGTYSLHARAAASDCRRRWQRILVRLVPLRPAAHNH